MPDVLYKYQPFTAQSLANLKQRTLWFSPAVRFNDPFDCTLSPINSVLNREDHDRFIAYLAATHNAHAPAGIQRDDGSYDPAFTAALVDAVRASMATHRLDLSQKRGVACLTADPANLLMWSHYADGHRGFCLEFDATSAPFVKARAVEYMASVPSLNPMDILDAPDGDSLFRAMALTKASCWAYEQEWRLLHESASTAYTYPWQALTGIYFGVAADPVHVEIAAMILRDSPTRLYQMRRNDRDFAVVAQEVTYTPFNYAE